MHVLYHMMTYAADSSSNIFVQVVTQEIRRYGIKADFTVEVPALSWYLIMVVFVNMQRNVEDLCELQ
jgi:hypothetical protein